MRQKVIKVWIDDQAVYIKTVNGEIYSEQFCDYPRLYHAIPTQRINFEYDNIGIHWEELDEDLCYDGFMRKPVSADGTASVGE